MTSAQPTLSRQAERGGDPSAMEPVPSQHRGARLPLVAVATTVLVTLVWTLYRAMTDLPGWVDALVAKPLLWLGPVVLAVLLLERQSLASLVHPRPRLGRLGRDLAVGAGAAALLVAWTLRGHAPHPVSVSVYGVLVWPLATAAVEELVYRGYLMARLWAWCGDVWTANLLSAAAFALIHLPLLLLDQGQGLMGPSPPCARSSPSGSGWAGCSGGPAASPRRSPPTPSGTRP